MFCVAPIGVSSAAMGQSCCCKSGNGCQSDCDFLHNLRFLILFWAVALFAADSVIVPIKMGAIPRVTAIDGGCSSCASGGAILVGSLPTPEKWGGGRSGGTLCATAMTVIVSGFPVGMAPA